MNVYDSIERGAADECEPLRGRRPRTFTLTQLLVACVAVGVCAIAATMVVNTPHSSAGLDQTTLSAICELMCSAQRAAGCPVHPINYI